MENEKCQTQSCIVIVSIEGSAACAARDPLFRDIIGVQVVWRKTTLQPELIGQLLSLGLRTPSENTRELMIPKYVTLARVRWTKIL